MSHILKPLFAAGVLALTVSSCTKTSSNNYSKIPEITYRGMSENKVKYTDTGSWLMFFDFVDGDGDIGLDPQDTVMAITIKNLTTGVTYLYPFPYVPKSARGSAKFLKGTGNIKLRKSAFFLPRADSIHALNDTFQFEVFVKDNAGNLSNTIKSDIVYITR